MKRLLLSLSFIIILAYAGMVAAVDMDPTARGMAANADAILLGHMTPVQIGGEFFSCIASTTSTAFYNSSGTALLLGLATGTHELYIQASNTGSATTAYLPFGCTKVFTVWVATTTEILGDVITAKKSFSTSSAWDVGIATSATRGMITLTASCAAPLGSLWILRVYRNTGGLLW